MNYINIIVEIAVLMTYILIGYIVRWKKIVSEHGIREINRLIVNIALPLLIIKSINIEYRQEYINNMLQIALASFAYLSLAYIISRKILNHTNIDAYKAKSMRFSMIFGNVAFLGLPLSNSLFGEVGMFYASIYVIIQNLFIWTLGVSIFSGEKLRLTNLKNLINPGIVAIIVGLTMFFLNIKPFPVLNKVINGISSITIPLALVIIGATLYNYDMKKIVADNNIRLIAATKTLLFPLAFMVLLYFIPMNDMLKSIFVIQAASPIQVSAAAYATNFGGDYVIPAKGVFLSTILCLVTIPLFVFLINI